MTEPAARAFRWRPQCIASPVTRPGFTDSVIAATGFRTGLEPLVERLGVLDEGGVPLVHGADEHPSATGLHFVGFVVSLGGTLRLIGKQAERLAQIAA